MNIRRKFLAACLTGVAFAGSVSTADAQITTTTNRIRLVFDASTTLMLVPPASGGHQTLTFPNMSGGGSFIMSSSTTGQTITSGSGTALSLGGVTGKGLQLGTGTASGSARFEIFTDATAQNQILAMTNTNDGESTVFVQDAGGNFRIWDAVNTQTRATFEKGGQANFANIVNAGSGFKINNAAAADGTFLRGDGTDFVAGTIQSSDLPDLSGEYLALAGGTMTGSIVMNDNVNANTTTITEDGITRSVGGNFALNVGSGNSVTTDGWFGSITTAGGDQARLYAGSTNNTAASFDLYQDDASDGLDHPGDRKWRLINDFVQDGSDAFSIANAAGSIVLHLTQSGASSISNLQINNAGVVTSGTWNGTDIAVADGGTGSSTAAGARTNLGAAASGVNSDITELTGLTSALTVAQGGTGATTFTDDGVLIGNGTAAVSAVAPNVSATPMFLRQVGDGSVVTSTTWTTVPTVAAGNGLTDVGPGTFTLGGTLTADATITTDDVGGGTSHDLIVNGDGQMAVTGSGTLLVQNAGTVINPSGTLTLGAFATSVNLGNFATTVNIGQGSGPNPVTTNLGNDFSTQTISGTTRFDTDFDAANYTILAFNNAAGDKTITFPSVTGTLATTADIGAATIGGDLSGTVANAQIIGGAVGTTEIANDAVTYAKLQDVGAASLVGNSTAGAADATNITLGAGLEFSGTTLVNDGVLTIVAQSGEISVDNTDPNNPVVGIDDNYTGQSSIVTVGTISGGTWQGNTIANAYVDDALTIEGGTIENTPIGVNTPNTGNFTTLAATDITANGPILVDTDGGPDMSIDETGISHAGTLVLTSTTSDVNIVADDANGFGVNITGDVSANGTIDAGGTIWSASGDVGTGSGNLRAATGNLVFEGSGQNIQFGAAATDGILNFRDGDGNVMATLTDNGTSATLTVGTIVGNMTGNATNVTGIVAPANGGTGSSTVPTSGQILIGNAGNTAYAPQTMSGDATISNTGAVTVTSFGGTSFGTMAGQNANNVTISGGTVAASTVSGNITGNAANVTGIVAPTNGGTGVNNGASTITLGGSLTTSGANTLEFITTGNTSITLPTSGTLATTNDLNNLGNTYLALTNTADKTVALNDATANRTLTITNTDPGFVANLVVEGSVTAAGVTSSNGLTLTGTGVITIPNGADLRISDGTNVLWDPLESTCRHASLSIL